MSEEGKSLIQKMFDGWRSFGALRKAVLWQISCIVTLAMGLAVVSIYYFSQSRVPMLLNEHQLIARHMSLYFKESLRLKPTEYALTLQSAYPKFDPKKFKLSRMPKGNEVYLFRDKKEILRLGVNRDGKYWLTSWKADIKIYDEARGAVYILNNGGEVIFSNIVMNNILGREPVKEYFDSGLASGMRVYTSKKTKMISGFFKIPNSNTILFFETPLYGLRAQLMDLIRMMVLGGLIIAAVLSLLTFRYIFQLMAPLKEAEKISEAMAQGVDNIQSKYTNSPDFGGLISRILMVDQRLKFLQQNNELLLRKLKGASFGVDLIRSSSDNEAALRAWTDLAEKLLEMTFESVAFYQLHPSSPNTVITLKLIGGVSKKPQVQPGENQDPTEVQTEQNFQNEFVDIEDSLTSKWTLTSNPKTIDSIQSFLPEQSITERNGFTYFVGHQGKWVLSARPIPNLNSDPGKYLVMTILISILDQVIYKNELPAAALAPHHQAS